MVLYEVQERVWDGQPPSGLITYVKGLVRRLGLLHIRGHDCDIVDPTGDGGVKSVTAEGGTEVRPSRVAAVTEGRV